MLSGGSGRPFSINLDGGEGRLLGDERAPSTVGGVAVVIVLLEERCLWCSEKLTGTLELLGDRSRTDGDFDGEHGADVQSGGADRVLKAINASGTCRACGTAFLYKAFSVIQMRAKAEPAAGQ